MVFVALVTLVPTTSWAQTSSLNAYSPYSMYGPGEIHTPGSVQMRSMGGVGIGLRSPAQINTLNPAAASVAPAKSFLFDVNIDATHYRNSQLKFSAEGSSKIRTAHNTGNIHNIGIAFPLAKNLGLMLNVSPYSSVGYKVKTTDEQQDNWADIGRVQYLYTGEGDITEVKLAIGWAPVRQFSIGVAARYFWGTIEREYTTQVTNVVTGSGVYASTKGVDSFVLNNFKFQAGVQWNIISNDKRMLTFGATYDLGGLLNPRRQSYLYTNDQINSLVGGLPIKNDISKLELRLPHQIGAGLYYVDRKISWGLDYSFAMWGDANESYVENGSNNNVPVGYTDTHSIKAGLEYIPRRGDTRSYFNRMSYRVGARLGNYYQTFYGERINTMAITAGIGLPIRLWGSSSLNIGFEYGRMSAPQSVEVSGSKVGLTTQNYFKLSIGFSLFSHDTKDYWFVRQKFD